MARYQKAFNIWEVSDSNRARIQIGQWVKAGPDGPLGRFCGHGTSDVVAWHGNAKGFAKGKGKGGYAAYMAALFDYGKSAVNKFKNNGDAA